MANKVTTIRLPEDTIQDLNKLTKKIEKDKSEIMREAIKIGIHEINLRHHLQQYIEGNISFGKLAENTNLNHRQLYVELKQRNIPFRYGEDRLNEEIGQLAG